MRFSLMVLFVLSTSVSAQRYAGEFDFGEIIFRTDGTNGIPAQFYLTGKPNYSVELSVDRSQNVTFHEFEVTYSGRMEFDGHGGNVYADVNAITFVDADEIDMSPVPQGNHQFGIQPFYVDHMQVSGTYFNRGFENDFSQAYRPLTSYSSMRLSFEDFPESLTLLTWRENTVYWGTTDVIHLEPFLELNTVYLNAITDTAFELKLLPLPPDPILDPIGDSNLDGRFDSGDLVTVFQAGEYEDAILFNSTWETGDWNSDKEFDSGDLVSAFQAGKYEQPEAVAVPEPVGTLIVAIGFFFAARRCLHDNSSIL